VGPQPAPGLARRRGHRLRGRGREEPQLTPATSVSTSPPCRRASAHPCTGPGAASRSPSSASAWPRLREVFASVANSMTRRQLHTVSRPRMRIAAFASFSARLLPGIIESVAGDHPNLRFDIQLNEPARAVAARDQRVPQDGETHLPEMTRVGLFDDEYRVVVSDATSSPDGVRAVQGPRGPAVGRLRPVVGSTTSRGVERRTAASEATCGSGARADLAPVSFELARPCCRAIDRAGPAVVCRA
jgi:hypothetical protein